MYLFGSRAQCCFLSPVFWLHICGWVPTCSPCTILCERVCVYDTGHRVSTMERDEFHMNSSTPHCPCCSFLTHSLALSIHPSFILSPTTPSSFIFFVLIDFFIFYFLCSSYSEFFFASLTFISFHYLSLPL